MVFLFTVQSNMYGFNLFNSYIGPTQVGLASSFNNISSFMGHVTLKPSWSKNRSYIT